MTTSTIVVSPLTGRRERPRTKGTNLKGQPVDFVSLYEKQ